MLYFDADTDFYTFDASDATTVSFDTSLVTQPDRFIWTTQGGNQIEANGSGFTYDASGLPTGGTVTNVNIDLGSDGDFSMNSNLDVYISGVSASLQDLVISGNTQASATSFWQAVMHGNDRAIVAGIKPGLIFGDFLDVRGVAFNAVSLTGGDDNLNSEGASYTPLSSTLSSTPRALIGDAYSVEGASNSNIAYDGSLTGGNDTLSASGKVLYDNLVGDAYNVGVLGHVQGGNDVLTDSQFFDVYDPSRSPVALTGDVHANNGGVVSGGDDTLTGSDFSLLREALVGDTGINEAGTTTGGNDHLTGRGGTDVLAGDVYREAGGVVNGGNDTIHGGSDGDVIAGDVFAWGEGTLNAGDDHLFGGSGNDSIAGDVATFSGTIPSAEFTGGNDFLSGGSGNDTLYGDIGSSLLAFFPGSTGGNDTLDGGRGNDLLDGGGGSNTASFASVARAVVVDLNLGHATGQGNDTLYGIDNVIGSSKGDRVDGSSFANRISGGGGNDSLIGGGGHDTLNGGHGADRLFGGAATTRSLEAAAPIP